MNKFKLHITLLMLLLSIFVLSGCQTGSSEETAEILSNVDMIVSDVNDVNYLSNNMDISDNNPEPDIRPSSPPGPTFNSPEGKKEINNYINGMNKNIENQFNNESNKQ